MKGYLKCREKRSESVKSGILFREIIRLYKVDPYRIFALWVCNLIEMGLAAASPWIIGNCIDALSEHNYSWLFILIGSELTYLIFCALHRYIDTRSYSLIVKKESCRYYERMIKSDESDSTISSRLNRIDDIPDFILTGFPQIVSILVGILVSLIVLFFQSGSIVLLLALFMTIFNPVLTRKEKMNFFSNEKQSKDIDEKREDHIASRNIKKYAGLIEQTLRLLVANSDLDVKLFCKTYFLQTFLLVATILTTILTTQWTAGLLFSTIAYIQILNGYIAEINDTIISLQDLAETANRLYGFPKVDSVAGERAKSK